MSHADPGSEHPRAGGRRRGCGMTSCLYPGPFKTHTRTHTHRQPPSIRDSPVRPARGKGTGRGAPRLFREAFENTLPGSTAVALSSLHPQEKLRCPCPRWEPLEGHREREGGPGTPGICPRATGEKQGNRGRSPYCVPGEPSAQCPRRAHSGETKTEPQRRNLI